jgi:lipopolysaccharide export system protein LptA
MMHDGARRFRPGAAVHVVTLIDSVRKWRFAPLLLLMLLFASPCLADAEKPVGFYADDLRWEPDQKVVAKGNVKVTYQGLTVTADSSEADLQTNIAVFKGNVVLSTQNQKVNGESLKLDLKTRQWTLESAQSTIEPSAFKGMVTGPVFAQGSQVLGLENNEIKIESGTLTTCDQPVPHYAFKAHDLEIYPGSRIVAHKVDVMGLGYRLLRMNTLLIPLKMINRNFMPQVGNSTDEGAFIKAAIPYKADDHQQGFFKLDLMQKKGIGTGIDHSYAFDEGSGEVNLYLLRDRQLGSTNVTGSLQHHQKFGLLDLNFATNYRTNNYLYYPKSTSRDWQLGLNYGRPKSFTVFNYSTNTTTGFGTYTTSTASLRHSQQFDRTLSSVLQMDLRSYDSGGVVNTRNLQTSFDIRERNKKFDLALVANKSNDLGDSGSSNLGGIEKLPEITFNTDSYRVGAKYFLGIPSRISLSAGDYRENPLGTRNGRLLLQWDMLDKPIDIGDATVLNLNAGVRQAYYQSDMAQYVLKTGAVWTSSLSDYMKVRFSYNYQRPEGFSPFFFDTTGKYNYTRAVLDYQHDRRLIWSLSSGYDFYDPTYRWQVLNFRMSAHPNDRYGFALGAGYDLNRSRWQTILGQLQIGIPNHVSLDLGNRYDTQNHSLTSRARLDWKVNKRWRLESIASWNGDLKTFDYQAFRVTRDLHCMEASVTYTNETGFRTNRGFSFDLRIKALPFLDRFGINQFGQKIDTSLGQYLY